MGSCASNSSNEDHIGYSKDPLKRQRTKQLDLFWDDSSQLMTSYQRHDLLFQKVNYDWCSIPITNPIDCSCKMKFQVINKGITDDCFLVGVIKSQALQNHTRMPWKTNSVICFQSHKNDGESGIVHRACSVPCGRGVKKNQVLSILIDKQTIQFKVGKQSLGIMELPDSFRQTQIFPYIALFAPGDKIQLLHPRPNSMSEE